MKKEREKDEPQPWECLWFPPENDTRREIREKKRKKKTKKAYGGRCRGRCLDSGCSSVGRRGRVCFYLVNGGNGGRVSLRSGHYCTEL